MHEPLFSQPDADDMVLVVASFFVSTFFNMLWVDWKGKLGFLRAFRGAWRYGVFSAAVMAIYLALTSEHVAITLVVGFSGIVAMVDRKDLAGMARGIAQSLGEGLVHAGTKVLKWGVDKE